MPDTEYQRVSSLYIIKEFSYTKNKPYKSEKILCDHIEDNIEVLCKDLGIDFQSYKRECVLYGRGKAREHMSRIRIDFLITDKEGYHYLLEVKNPSSGYHPSMQATSQLLDYIILAEHMGYKIKKSFLLSTKYEQAVTDVIERFKLPIIPVYFNRSSIAYYERSCV